MCVGMIPDFSRCLLLKKHAWRVPVLFMAGKTSEECT